MFTLVPFFLTLLACGDGSASEPSQGTTAGATEVREGCPAASGMLDGTRVHYTYSEDGFEGTATAEVDGPDAEGLVLYHFEERGSDQDTTVEIITEYAYLCDTDGLWVLEVDTEIAYVAYGVRGQVGSLRSYDEPYLVMPYDFRVGDAWESSRRWTSVGDDGTQTEGSATVRTSVAGYEDIDVPAGEFAAWVLDEDWSGETARAWYADDVGLVARGGLELERL